MYCIVLCCVAGDTLDEEHAAELLRVNGGAVSAALRQWRQAQAEGAFPWQLAQ
jgi:hypothetical protein